MALVVLIAGAMISIILQLTNKKPAVAIPQELAGVVLPEARPLTPFSLTDHDNKPFDLSRLQGYWTFIFFGYTYCPDICPTALGELAVVFDNLSNHDNVLANTKGVFVSVDPQRDSPETLKDYVPYFNPDFIGATGTPDQIKAFSKQLGAAYMVASNKDAEGNYLVSHTSSLFVINPKGEFYAIYQPALFNPETISSSYLKMRSINLGENR